MKLEQKNEIIQELKEKFLAHNFFYLTNTESISVENINYIRKQCYKNNIELRVAKNTLIKKALASIDEEKYKEVYDALNGVTALFFSENPKSPAILIKDFRTKKNSRTPILKKAYINGDVYAGDDALNELSKLKTKNELIGEIVGLLQSPISRVVAALQNHHESNKNIEEK